MVCPLVQRGAGPLGLSGCGGLLAKSGDLLFVPGGGGGGLGRQPSEGGGGGRYVKQLRLGALSEGV